MADLIRYETEHGRVLDGNHPSLPAVYPKDDRRRWIVERTDTDVLHYHEALWAAREEAKEGVNKYRVWNRQISSRGETFWTCHESLGLLSYEIAQSKGLEIAKRALTRDFFVFPASMYNPEALGKDEIARCRVVEILEGKA